MNLYSNKIEEHLVKIKNILLYTGKMISTPGLNGSLGVAFFFSQYSHYTNNEIYNDLSIELITNIQSHMKQQYLMGQIKELSEIGLVVEHVVQNHYIETDSDEILADFDSLFSEFLMHQYLYLSFDDILDIGKYYILRIKGKRVLPKGVIPQLMKLIQMHMFVKPICSIKAFNILSELYLCSHLDKIRVLLESQLRMFEFSLLQQEPLRWSYTLLHISLYSDLLAHNNIDIRKINRYIKQNVQNCFDLESNSIINGKVAYLIWLFIIIQGMDVAKYRFLEEILESKYYFSLENSHSCCFDMGIYDGLAGIGMALLSLVDRRYFVWMSLL